MGRDGFANGAGALTGRAPAPGQRGWQVALLVLAALLLTGCAGERALRREQAEELRVLCQSIAARQGSSAAAIEEIGRWPLHRFTPGYRDNPLAAADLVFRACL